MTKVRNACQTPFRLVYGKQVVMPMQYIVSRLRFVAITERKNVDVVENRLLQLVHLEEEHFFAGFNHNVENQRQKVWHDRHIKSKHFKVVGLVIMYENKFFERKAKNTLVSVITRSCS